MSRLRNHLRGWLGVPQAEMSVSEFDTHVRKAMHNAYAGIVCAVCGKNVYRGENEIGWVHGNGGKAYCLKPCWNDGHPTPPVKPQVKGQRSDIKR